MKDTGYKRENHEIILQSPIPVQHRFIHNIDTKIVNMVDVENYSPTYSGDMPNFNNSILGYDGIKTISRK